MRIESLPKPTQWIPVQIDAQFLEQFECLTPDWIRDWNAGPYALKLSKSYISLLMN
jgi:hypothetical protein